MIKQILTLAIGTVVGLVAYELFIKKLVVKTAYEASSYEG